MHGHRLRRTCFSQCLFDVINPILNCYTMEYVPWLLLQHRGHLVYPEVPSSPEEDKGNSATVQHIMITMQQKLRKYVAVQGLEM